MSSLQEHGGQSRAVNTYWVGPLWTEAAFLGKEDESHRQPLPPLYFLPRGRGPHSGGGLLPKGPQKGILTPQSPNPKPNHLKLPTCWGESCVSGEQDGLAQSHSQT